MNTLAKSMLFWLALIAALGTVYVLPSLIAAFRKTESLGWIIVLNLPTGVGWLAALVLALTLPRREPPPPVPGLWNPYQQEYWQ